MKIHRFIKDKRESFGIFSGRGYSLIQSWLAYGSSHYFWDLALMFEMWLIISKQWTPLPSQSSSHSLDPRIPWTLFLFFGSPNLSPELNFADYFFILFPWFPHQSSFTCHPKAPLGLPTTFPHHQVPSRFFSNFPCLCSPLFRPFQ